MSYADKTENKVVVEVETLQQNKAKEAAVLRYIEEQNEVLKKRSEETKSAFEKIKELVGGIFGVFVMFFVAPLIFNRRGRNRLIFYVIKILIITLLVLFFTKGMDLEKQKQNSADSNKTTSQTNR